MGKLSRTKGADYERAVAIDLRSIFPDAKRGLQSRGGGAEVPDVEIPHYHIECKRGKLPNPRAALKQAKRDAAADRTPVAIIRDDNARAFVCMDYHDWLALIWMVHRAED